MPGGSYMSKIQKRGRLIAGVSADTLLLVLLGHGTYDGIDAKFNLVLACIHHTSVKAS